MAKLSKTIIGIKRLIDASSEKFEDLMTFSEEQGFVTREQFEELWEEEKNGENAEDGDVDGEDTSLPDDGNIMPTPNEDGALPSDSAVVQNEINNNMSAEPVIPPTAGNEIPQAVDGNPDTAVNTADIAATGGVQPPNGADDTQSQPPTDDDERKKTPQPQQ